MDLLFTRRTTPNYFTLLYESQDLAKTPPSALLETISRHYHNRHYLPNFYAPSISCTTCSLSSSSLDRASISCAVHSLSISSRLGVSRGCLQFRLLKPPSFTLCSLPPFPCADGRGRNLVLLIIVKLQL
jgi:hypothetical protein